MTYPHLNALTAGVGPDGAFKTGYMPNPWFNLSNQFTPRNLHDIIKWARYITVQSPTVTEVIRKYATYPITDFNIDTDSEDIKTKYKELINSVGLKTKLKDMGFEDQIIGNCFVSIYFPITRTLVCNSCKTAYNSKNAKFLKFKQYQFHGQCPACKEKGFFRRVDTKSMSVADLNLVLWDPQHIAVNHNPITGESEYLYTIPNTVKRKIMEGDRLFIDSVPWSFVEAVKNNQDFKFDNDNIYHMANLRMGSGLPGLGMPPIISLYSLVFYQAVLRKANEAIASEYLNPLRVVFPSHNGQNGDPVAMMSMQGFARRMESELKIHKQDPNRIVISPIPVGYQTVGGEGRSLLVSQELDQAEKTMLLGMGVSHELLSGTTNWTSSTVGLRLLENTLINAVDNIKGFMEWFFDKTCAYYKLDRVDVTLTPFKLTDDFDVKRLLFELAGKGDASMSTMFDSLGLDYRDELEKAKDDYVKKSMLAREADNELRKESYNKDVDMQDEDSDDSRYSEATKTANEHIVKMLAMAPEQRSQVLQSLYQSDQALLRLVLDMMQEQGISPETLMTPWEESLMKAETGVDPKDNSSNTKKEEDPNPIKEKNAAPNPAEERAAAKEEKKEETE